MTDSDAGRPDRIAELFEQAVRLPPDERAAFLDRECGADDALRAELESLLEHHDHQGEFLAGPTADLTASPSAADLAAVDLQPGTVIGRYTLRRRVGDGTFGVVYLAEQTAPVRREVALKIIKLGMDTAEVLARFEAERQALAVMSHPNVATVHDAGTTETGRPYFVMEYVPGEPITAYCDLHRLSTIERLGLFIQACEAIQHAHQKGIIHRDIKPTNILVAVKDGQAQVKVIDFGVAKATQQRLTERTLFTELGQLIGTPTYMSPEQAEMRTVDIDTRSDIYSLGVLLYELLTGSLPFDETGLREAGHAEIQRIIREVDPPKPSTKLSTLGEATESVARKHRCDARALLREVRGDLDWVVMRCLEKDRTRRYESAAGLADDVRRHLKHEPVLAGPPSAGYRLRKFARRHRGALGAAMVIIIATVLAAVFGGRELAARRELAIRTEQVDRVTRFQASMFRDLEPMEVGQALHNHLLDALREPLATARAADTIAATDVLAGVDSTGIAINLIDTAIFERTAIAIAEVFTDDPETEAQLYHELADVCRRLGLSVRALEAQDRALELRLATLGPTHIDTLHALANKGLILLDLGRHDEALAICDKVLTLGATVEVDTRDTATVLNTKSSILDDLGRFDESIRCARDAFEQGRAALGADDEDVLVWMNGLGFSLINAGAPEEGVSYLLECLERRQRVHGDTHLRTFSTHANLGLAYDYLGELELAHEHQTFAYDGYLAELGADHDKTLTAQAGLASILHTAGRYPEAVEVYYKVLERRKRQPGRAADVASTLSNIGDALSRYGDVDEAIAISRRALNIWLRERGETHTSTLRTKHNIADMLLELGEAMDALPLSQAASKGAIERVGWEHSLTQASVSTLIAIYERLATQYSDGEFQARAAEWRARLDAVQSGVTSG